MFQPSSTHTCECSRAPGRCWSRRESDSQVTWHRFSVACLMNTWSCVDMCMTSSLTIVRNNHHNHNNQASIPKRAHIFCASPVTMDLSGQPTGAAQRRKQRRLRSWWRHEQQSIAAVLATFQHHRADGDRRWPAPGKRFTRCTSRPRSGRIFFSRRQVCSTSSSTMTSHLPPAPGQTGCLPCRDRMSGFCGTPRSSLPTVCQSRRRSMLLCRRGLRRGWERGRPLRAASSSCSSTARTRASRGHPPGPCSATSQASDSDGGAAVVRGPREKRHSHVGADCIHRSVIAWYAVSTASPGRKTNTGRAEAGSRASGCDSGTGHRTGLGRGGRDAAARLQVFCYM